MRATFLSVLAFAAFLPATASAKVSDCSPRRVVDNSKLANAGVSSVRNMSCAAARRAIKRHGRGSSQAPYGEAGARFGLGPWACTVYYHNYELWKARCTKGSRAFRVEYGF